MTTLFGRQNNFVCLKRFTALNFFSLGVKCLRCERSKLPRFALLFIGNTTRLTSSNKPVQQNNTNNNLNRNKTRILYLQIVLFALYQISCFSNGWLVNEDEYVGLWQLCSQSIGCLWMEQSPSYDG